MIEKIRKPLKLLSDVLVVLVVLLAFLLYGTRLLGLTPYMVLSGSMEKAYPTGSLIYVAKVDPAQLEVGDAVTYTLPGGTVSTHRIVELVPDAQDPKTVCFRTKGDANPEPDNGLVGFESVLGKPVFCIPFMGRVANYLATPSGRYLTVTVAVALVLLEIILGILAGPKEKKTKENSQIEKGVQKHEENDKSMDPDPECPCAGGSDCDRHPGVPD